MRQLHLGRESGSKVQGGSLLADAGSTVCICTCCHRGGSVVLLLINCLPHLSSSTCSGGLIKPGEPGSEGQCTITVASECGKCSG